MLFMRSDRQVTALDYAEYLGHRWLVTGYEKIVRLWDCTPRTSAIDVAIEQLVGIKLLPNDDSLLILTKAEDAAFSTVTLMTLLFQTDSPQEVNEP
jgi:hypothetical protein